MMTLGLAPRIVIAATIAALVWLVVPAAMGL